MSPLSFTSQPALAVSGRLLCRRRAARGGDGWVCDRLLHGAWVKGAERRAGRLTGGGRSRAASASERAGRDGAGRNGRGEEQHGVTKVIVRDGGSDRGAGGRKGGGDQRVVLQRASC